MAVDSIIHTYRASTMTELHELLCQTLVHAQEKDLDMVTSVDVQIHNVLAQADSMDWEFDLKTMWLTKSRWSMMVRQYIDPDRFKTWIQMITSKIGVKGRGIAVLRTNEVKARGGEATGHDNKESRRWGSCMLSLSYKALPEPTIILHSRTSYLGYLGALDLSVAWMCAKHLAKELGVPVESFKFLWFNEAIQFHNFKSVAYLMNHPDPALQTTYRRCLLEKGKELSVPEKRMLLSSPALKLTRAWMQKVVQEDAEGKSYGDMTYNTYRRIRRRYHTETFGYEYAKQFEGWEPYRKGPKTGQPKVIQKAYRPLPSVPIETCDLSPLKLLPGGTYGEDYEEEAACDCGCGCGCD